MHEVRNRDEKADDSFGPGAAPEDANEASLRVVHVVQHLKSGGAETLVRGLCAGLARAGVALTVVSIYDDGLDAAERAALPFPIVTIGRRGRGDLTFFPRLVAALRGLAPDVVHAHLHAGKYAGRIAALAAGCRTIVFTEHGDEAGGVLRAALGRILNPLTTRFVTFTEAERQNVARKEGVPLERIVVIPNGVAAPPAADRTALRAALGMAADTVAGYIPARITTQKNHALALRAWARVWRDDERRQLYIAGKGPLEAQIRRLVDSLGLRDRVHFLGFRDDASTLCRAMDVFLMPSLWERMPMALGEAMRAGLPVVTTDWAGVADFVTDGLTGFIAHPNGPADDVDAFGRALVRTQDDAVRRRVAERARAFADRRFDLDASVRRHVALYASIARPARRGAR
jgi:glycosyltransferase involved in cell wall biosynthesis